MTKKKSDKVTATPSKDSARIPIVGIGASVEDALIPFRWLLEKEQGVKTQSVEPAYEDVTELNHDGLILNAVGAHTLKQLAGDVMDLLDTCMAVYEKNGDYAFGTFVSGWCGTMDNASRALCETDDNQKALNCGKWLCHESCWKIAKKSIDSGEPVDEGCCGGLRIYAVPIHSGGQIIGVINFGYGNPPQTVAEQKELAEAYQLDLETIQHHAENYKTRPPFVINVAKRRLQSIAHLIGEIVERKAAEEKLRESAMRLSVATQASGIGVWDRDIVNNELVWDDRMFEIYGVKQEDFNGAHEAWKQGLHPDDLERTVAEVAAAESGKIPFDTEFRIVRPNGDIRYIKASGQVLRADDGAPLRMIGTNIDITDSKQAEEALRLSEAWVQSVIRAAPTGIGVVVDRTLKEVNEQLCVMAGYSKEELIGQSSRIFYSTDEDYEYVGREKYEQIRDHGTGTVETCWTCKDGRRIDVLLSSTPMDLNDLSKGVTFTALDITERKQAEEALAESALKYQTLADSGQALIWTSGLDKLCNYFNQPWIDFTGRSLEQEMGEGWTEGLHPEDFDYCVQTYVTAFDQHKPFSMEYRMIHNSGEYRWIQDNGSPRFDKNGVFLGYIGHCLDITERKEVEEALRESEEMMRNSQSVAHICSYSINLNVNEIEKSSWVCSPEFYKIFGIDENYPHTIDGWANFIHPDYRKEMIDYHESVVKERKSFSRDYKIIRINDGAERWVHGTGELEFDEVGDPVRMHGAIQDITERKQAEEEQEKLNDRLAQMQNLESLGLLAGGIAHDFNNLLGGIYGYIDLALDDTTQESVSDYLNESLSSIGRARSLTQQLLTFSKGGAPIKKEDSLFPSVQKTAEFALSGSSVSSSFQIQESLWSCNFDKNQIGQVIENLIINAKQAMPNGGTIEVSAQNISLSEKEHNSLGAGNYVKLSIKDHGIGIPENFLKKIFDPYYTTKPQGHGLGLATCYSIVNRHGGCIDVESEPGKGCTFHLFLPASTVPVEKSKRNFEGKQTHKGIGTFLVMDDEADIRKITKIILESMGYTVVLKENGKDAIDFFKTEIKANRKLAGMIFDLTIPGGMGGKEAIGEIRKICSETPVFVASGYSNDPVMMNPELYGFNAGISKPFKIADLSEMLKKHL